jgi:hypothetical protein
MPATTQTLHPPSRDPSEVLRLAAFRRRREANALGALALVFMAAIVVSLATAGLRAEIPLPAWGVVVVAIAVAVAFTHRNARCPSCESYLGTGIRSAHFCSRCGAKLMAE